MIYLAYILPALAVAAIACLIEVWRPGTISRAILGIKEKPLDKGPLPGGVEVRQRNSTLRPLVYPCVDYKPDALGLDSDVLSAPEVATLPGKSGAVVLKRTSKSHHKKSGG